ncbi:MAG TPA: hypothetical protein VFZ58_04850 [Candidatus Saccharimonadales bacterium]
MKYHDTSSQQEAHFDPDDWPDVDTALIHARSSYFPQQSYYLSQRSTHNRLRHFAQTHKKESDECAERIIYHSAGQVAGRRYESAVIMPIGVSSEPLDTIEESLASVNETALALGRHTCVLAWLNYAADNRRERGKFDSEAADMADKVKLMVPASTRAETGVDLAIAIDRYGVRRKISKVRHRTHLGIGHLAMKSWARDIIPHDISVLFCDADTRLGIDALPEADELLRANKALMVNGQLHYVGGVMDMPPQEVGSKHGSAYKLLYLSEHLRRLMMDHLPSSTNHAYRPESGMAIQLGPLTTLGGFNTDSADNETYWLATAAKKASTYWHITSRHTTLQPEPLDKGPYLDNLLAQRLESFHIYGDYQVDTSIRGLERMVLNRGPASLKGYDQGHQYALWSDAPEANPDADRLQLPLNEELHILDDVYAYFKSCGGIFRAEDIGDFNQRVKAVLAPSNLEAFVWLPSK